MKNWKMIFVLALVAMVCSVNVTPSSAYTLIGMDWNWLGGNPVTVNIYVNPNCADPTAPNELASIQSAMNTWTNAPADFAFNYAGATSSTGHVMNGQNEVNWSTGSSGGALAATSLWGQGGNFSECDVVFYDEWVWNTNNPGPNEFDVESVGLHELGHVVGLDHSQFPNAVMWFSIADGEVQRVLDQDDIDGIVAIYNQGPVTPVVLASFSATAAPDGIRLSWNTASEINCYGWNIQRAQGGDFADVSPFISGNGTTVEPHNYNFVDQSAEAGRTFSYRLKQIDLSGRENYSEPISVSVAAAPTEYRLSQNAPNPFNPLTSINFALPQASHVRLTVFDAQGHNIATLVNGLQDAGVHAITWNAADLSSGVYFYRLEAGSYTAAHKMVLMK